MRHVPKHMLRLALALLALLALPGTLHSQIQRRVEISPFAGGTFFRRSGANSLSLERPQSAPQIIDAPRFEDTWSAGITGALRVNDVWAIEGMMVWTPTWLVGSNFQDGTDVYDYTWAASAVASAPIPGPFRPFAGVGLGTELDDYSGSIASHANWFVALQAGLSLELGDGRALRVIGRDNVARNVSVIPGGVPGWQHDFMISGGVTWSIPVHRQLAPDATGWRDLEPEQAQK